MRTMLLGCAAAALIAGAMPAQAEFPGREAGATQTTAHGVRITRGPGDDRFRGRDGDHRRHRDRDRGVFIGGYWPGGEWALHNNRSWQSDSYNDWWHDRTDRSYPRWVANNANCERMWFSGSGWRC